MGNTGANHSLATPQLSHLEPGRCSAVLSPDLLIYQTEQ